MNSLTTGSQSAVALVKSAMTAAQNAFEGVQKASNHAASVSQTHMQAMAQTASRAAQPPSGRSPGRGA